MGRGLDALSSILLSVCLVLLFGCVGEQGPVGPQGPQGEALSLKIVFTGTFPVVRADGSSSVNIKIKISTLAGNNAADIPVTFSITSGTGMLAPTEAKTDLGGEASCTFTSGTAPGTVIISAAIVHAGLTISELKTIYLDPSSVSLPLLSGYFFNPLRAHFSTDGNTIIFETNDSKNFGLFTINVQGGTPRHLGAYRSGPWNPDGSNLIAAYNVQNKIYLLDKDGNISAGPFIRMDFMAASPRWIGCIPGPIWFYRPTQMHLSLGIISIISAWAIIANRASQIIESAQMNHCTDKNLCHL